MCQAGVSSKCVKQVCQAGMSSRCVKQVCQAGVSSRCVKQVCQAGVPDEAELKIRIRFPSAGYLSVFISNINHYYLVATLGS